MTDTTEPVTVQFAITPTTVIGSHWTEDGPRDITLAEKVAEIIADKVYRHHTHDDDWIDRAALNNTIDRIVTERVQRILDAPVTRTDSFGNPQGPSAPLAELIDARVTTWLREATKTDPYSSTRGRSNLQTIIDKGVTDAVTKDVNEAMAEAKKEAAAAIKTAASQVFSDTIARAAGVK